MLHETPIALAWGIVLMLTVGWMPGYLVFGATAQAQYRGKNVNHFSPNAAFFDSKDFWLIVQTDIAFLLAVTVLVLSICAFGIGTVAFFYLIPYAIAN